MGNNKLTIEELRRFKGLENVSEEYAIKVIDELYLLSQILIGIHKSKINSN